ENAYDNHTDIQIMKAVKESDEVILAWGAYAKKPVVEARVNEVLEMLKPHKTKVKQLMNPVTNEIMHPLNPKARDRKSTRLNSSHVSISYAVFCLKKKQST